MQKLRNGVPQRQRGAVLYVALIMMVLLALIGIVGMRVAGLQERMSANYRDVNQAFQLAELAARENERDIQTTVGVDGVAFLADSDNCKDGFSTTKWAAEKGDAAQAAYVRQIDRCIPSDTLTIGAKANENTNSTYVVSVLRTSPGERSSAVIETVFIPR